MFLWLSSASDNQWKSFRDQRTKAAHQRWRSDQVITFDWNCFLLWSALFSDCRVNDYHINADKSPAKMSHFCPNTSPPLIFHLCLPPATNLVHASQYWQTYPCSSKKPYTVTVLSVILHTSICINIGKHSPVSTKNPKAALGRFFAHSHYRKIFEDSNKYNVSILLGGTELFFGCRTKCSQNLQSWFVYQFTCLSCWICSLKGVVWALQWLKSPRYNWNQ